jgi:hypothetical protein
MYKFVVSIVVSAILVALVIMPSPVTAQANHHPPTDDTWVQNTVPNANFNGSQLLADYSNLPNFVITRRIYLRFDLSTISADVGDGTNVRLYITYPPFTDGTLAIYSTDNDWNGATVGSGGETTLTFNNAPPPSTLLATSIITSETTGWFSFNSTALHSYINSRRVANGGDNTISFAIQWNSCTPGCSLEEDVSFEDRENSGSTGHPPELVTFTPTAVHLASFTATSSGDHNTLTWVTVSELRNLGFNLWRGASAGAPTDKLNTDVIPSQAPGGTDGFAYTYDDQTIVDGTDYYYWLEDVDLNGAVTRHGPVSASVTGVAPNAVRLTSLTVAAPSATSTWPLWGVGLIMLAGAAVWAHRRK